jgi:hypothetical protein
MIRLMMANLFAAHSKPSISTHMVDSFFGGARLVFSKPSLALGYSHLHAHPSHRVHVLKEILPTNQPAFPVAMQHLMYPDRCWSLLPPVRHCTLCPAARTFL